MAIETMTMAKENLSNLLKTRQNTVQELSIVISHYQYALDKWVNIIHQAEELKRISDENELDWQQLYSALYKPTSAIIQLRDSLQLDDEVIMITTSFSQRAQKPIHYLFNANQKTNYTPESYRRLNEEVALDMVKNLLKQAANGKFNQQYQHLLNAFKRATKELEETNGRYESAVQRHQDTNSKMSTLQPILSGRQPSSQLHDFHHDVAPRKQAKLSTIQHSPRQDRFHKPVELKYFPEAKQFQDSLDKTIAKIQHYEYLFKKAHLLSSSNADAIRDIMLCIHQQKTNTRLYAHTPQYLLNASGKDHLIFINKINTTPIQWTWWDKLKGWFKKQFYLTASERHALTTLSSPVQLKHLVIHEIQIGCEQFYENLSKRNDTTQKVTQILNNCEEKILRQGQQVQQIIRNRRNSDNSPQISLSVSSNKPLPAHGEIRDPYVAQCTLRRSFR